MTYRGKPIRRREDVRFITGKGRYIADLNMPGTLDLAFARSPHGHARIVSVDAESALSIPGVHAALTGAQLEKEAPDLFRYIFPPLASKSVHYVGEPIAVVAAESRYAAEDGVGAIEADYDPLPAVTIAEEALRDGAPLVHEDRTNNVAMNFSKSFGDFDAALEEADVVVRDRWIIRRAAAHPLETRGVLAAPDPTGRNLQVWAATQSAHAFRHELSQALKLSPQRIQVMIPDVGGGFGLKNGVHPEDILAAWLALRLNRPIRWIEDRREHFTSATHAREQVHDVTLAADREGRILGFKDVVILDQGAYVQRGPIVPHRTLLTLPGPYRIPSFHAEMYAVYTNKVSIGPYRGAGRPQANYVMERTMDRLAEAVGLSRDEVRRRNLLKPEEFPYENGLIETDGSKVIYDSGNYEACLDTALRLAGWNEFEKEQLEARSQGRMLGLGLAFCTEDSGSGAYESATVRLEMDGTVTVVTGSPSQGQGHETVYAQVAADYFGLPIEEVRVEPTNTVSIGAGWGTFGSRSAIVGGSAVAKAAEGARKKVLQFAASMMEASEEDLEIVSGHVQVIGAPDRKLKLKDLAAAAFRPRAGLPLTPDLSETVHSAPANRAYPNSCHLAKIEIDGDSGEVRVLDYYVVHDCGIMLNPTIVHGQIVGGIAMGLSTALLEEIVYDENGQLLTGSYMDYLLPSTTTMPPIHTEHLETPSPSNPLGVKGVGEGGVIPALQAISSAVEDAVRHLGIRIHDLPIAPDRLQQMLQQAEEIKVAQHSTSQPA